MKNGKIKWITYNLENPPAEDIKYLITDGNNTDFGSIGFDAFDKDYRWFPYDNCEFGADHITHYAIISLPEKEVFDNKVFEKENKKND